jgi:aminoglycoside phosphotransferase (APT) family kinase protein
LLDAHNPRTDTIAAAVELIARLHTRAAPAPILAECRRQLNDLGMPYFVSNVSQAIAGLESLHVLEQTFTSAQRVVRHRLLDRLHTLHESIPLRAQLMRELGGHDTLLHGDLWTINTFVIPGPQGLEARLIDWDRAGVGPVAYDVSTFLYRFPADQRLWILNEYSGALNRAGWRLPEPIHLNVLFETAECARYANRIIWPAAALLSDGAESCGHDELAQVLGWFESLEPVLPNGRGQVA